MKTLYPSHLKTAAAMCFAAIIFISTNGNAQTTLLSSGFETGDPAFSYYMNQGASLTAGTTSPRTGTKCGLASSVSGANNPYEGAVVSSSAFTFYPCRTYTINVYARVTKCTGVLKAVKCSTSSFAAVSGASGTDILINSAGSTNVTSTSYALFTATFSVTATETMYLGFYMNSGGCGGSGAAMMHIDDVTLVEDAGAPAGGTASASATSVACGGSTTNLSLAGYAGSIQWQSSPDNATWTNITGATASTYTPTVYSTTYYRAQASKNCSVSTSNTLTITVTGSSTKTWVTTGTTAWGTASNWSPSGVPTSCNDVVIPSGGTQPTISAATSCRNLTINSGAALTVSSTLNVYGNLTNNGNINDALGYVDLYGNANTWSGSGTYLNGSGGQEGWIRIKNGCNYTLASNINAIYQLNAGGASTTGVLNLSTYTIIITSALYNTFYLNYNSGIVDLRGGGSVDPAKSNYGTGTLWINSSTNGFNFNLEDDYYNVWFSNSAGTTKFGSSAIDVYVSNDIWIRSGTLDLSSAGANTIHVGGDFTNDGSFSASTATIRMNGSQAQEIGGTSVSTFYKLTIDNSAAAGVTLTQDENVSNTLTLTNSPLNLNTRRLTVTNGSPTAITRTNGYVVSESNAAVNNSILQWNLQNGVGTFVYPFGVSGSYIPFTFDKTTNGTTNVSISTRATSGSNNSPWAGASNVAAVNNMTSYVSTYYADASTPSIIDRWWDITASSAVTANLTFSYRGSENTTTAAPVGVFKAQHWNGADWDVPVGSGTGVTSGVGTVSVSGASTFSPWILSSSSVVLPVDVINFTAGCSENKVVVKWETISENNNDYFTVEKSIDGHNFVEAGIIQGAGKSNTNLKYEFVDMHPFDGLSYYRLKQTDFSGNSKYFMAAATDCKKIINTINAYNNQNGEIVVNIDTDSESNYSIVMFDALGNKIALKNLNTSKGVNNISFDASQLASGVYFILCEDGSKRVTKKIIVNN